MELPGVVYLWLLSDNLTCNANHVLPVLALFMVNGTGFSLSDMHHSEAQPGKGPVDAHFAMAMRKVIRFCNENAGNVNIPSDILVAQGYGHGLASTAADWIAIRRDHPCLQLWKEALPNKSREQLGRMSDIVNKEIAEVVLMATTYEYSSGTDRAWARLHILESPI